MENIIFIIIVAIICVGFALWATHRIFLSEALEDTALALILFGGRYGSMLARAEGGGVNRTSLSEDDEMICSHLEEAGLLTEFPGIWVLSQNGERALSTVSNDVKKLYAEVG